MNNEGDESMNSRACKVMFLLTFSTLSANIQCADLHDRKFDGMQLAWTRVPTGKTEEKKAVKPKHKPKQQTIKPAVIKPAQPAAVIQVSPPPPVPVKPATSTPPVKAVTPLVARSVIVPAAKPAKPYASKESPSFEWLLGLGFDLGGDELGTVVYSDGSTASVKANTGIALSMGALIRNGKDSAFSTQLSVGYKSGGPKMWSRDVNWSSFPLEIIEHYRFNNLRLGLGLSYQLNPQLKVDVPTANFINKYNNAAGFIALLGWMPAGEHYSIDLRYTSISFQLSDVPDAPLVNGNAGGLYATYYY